MPDTRHNASDGDTFAYAISLTVPALWGDAVTATTAALRKAFPSVPPAMFAPHISLCQSFCTAEPEAVIAAVERIVRGLPPALVRVGGVRSFDDADGSPLVLYLEAQAPWLRLAHLRLLRETAPYRIHPENEDEAPGNPAFDLEGYTPHITLLFARYLLSAAERGRALREAVATWAARRPPGEGFPVSEVVVSTYPMSGDPALAEPRLLSAWRVGERGSAE
jgi:2'-5' RNA ligase